MTQTLREKIAEALVHPLEFYRSSDDIEYHAADAILSVIAESVEPLVWEGLECGSYYIELDATGVANLYNNQDRDRDGCIDSMIGGFVNLVPIDELKAAAQADYNRRILSALGLVDPNVTPS